MPAPTARLFILVLPQKEQMHLECCLISLFVTVFQREAPWWVPYLPTILTSLVCLAVSPQTRSQPREDKHFLQMSSLHPRKSPDSQGLIQVRK